MTRGLRAVVERSARVVVTGATGFIGRHLLSRLRSDRVPVVAVVRTPPARGSIDHGVSYVVRDLQRIDTLSDVLEEGDAIVHLAARAHILRDGDPLAEETYQRSNVAPTRMLCRSAVERGARRIVFMSSAKVFGEGRDRPYERSEAPAPGDAYARSKLEAEHVLREVAETGGVEWTILRPPFVYGAGGKGNFPRLVALARLATRLPLPLASIQNRRSIVYVLNLVDAIVRCGLDDRAAGQVLLPKDARDVSTPELLRSIAEVSSRRAMLFPCPPRALRAAAALIGRSPEMDRLTESLRLDARHLSEELGWDPPFSVHAALEQTMSAGIERRSATGNG